MDYSLAIKLEKDEKKLMKSHKETGSELQKQAAKEYKCQLDEYYRNAGQAHYELGQYEEAMVHFSLSIRELEQSNNPNQPLNFFNRGLCHMKLGNPVLANDDFQDAITKHAGKEQYKDDIYRIHYNKGINQLLNLHNPDEAVKSLKNAIVGGPNLQNEEKSAAFAAVIRWIFCARRKWMSENELANSVTGCA